MGTTTEKLEHLNETKALIKQAIISKGQPVSNTDTFKSYANKISAISTSLNYYKLAQHGPANGSFVIPKGKKQAYVSVTTITYSDANRSVTATGGATVTKVGSDSDSSSSSGKTIVWDTDYFKIETDGTKDVTVNIAITSSYGLSGSLAFGVY